MQVFEVFNSITQFHELSVGLIIGNINSISCKFRQRKYLFK